MIVLEFVLCNNKGNMFLFTICWTWQYILQSGGVGWGGWFCFIGIVDVKLEVL